MKVQRAIGDKPLTKEGLLDSLNRIVVPTLRELLRAFNGLSYEKNFTSFSVVSGTLTVEHGLGGDIQSVTVRDNADRLRALPDLAVTLTSATVCTVDLSSFGAITGTWRVLVQRG